MHSSCIVCRVNRSSLLFFHFVLESSLFSVDPRLEHINDRKGNAMEELNVWLDKKEGLETQSRRPRSETIVAG